MRSNKGFTIVELIIVLSLLCIILTGVLNFMGFSLEAVVDIKAQTIVQYEVNTVLRTLANDIRSATKPDLTIKSIVIYKDSTPGGKGERMDIYDYKDGKYILISYKYEDNVLYRGVKEADNANDIINEQVDYSTFLEGVIYPSEPETEMFEDVTSNPNSDRRTININFSAQDKEGRIRKPVVITATYTSRSKGMP
ncbi:MAG: type II secretion system protein [Clostridiaceae bacterium]|nr:type II secretion system protein [Clostridiaceae bacterium]